MRGVGEIEWLSFLCQPEISIVTNVGTSHIGVLGSIDKIFEAKIEIVKNTHEYILLPSEKRFKNLSFEGVIPIFIGDNGDCSLIKYEYLDDGIEFGIKYKQKEFEKFKIRSYSYHNIINAMFAIVVGFLKSVDVDKIKKGLLKFCGEEMREEIVNINGITVINDCYNASFESVKSAIFMVRKYADINGKRANALIGDMLEQGKYSNELHFRIGEMARDCGIEKLYATGRYARCTMDGFLGGIYIDDPIKEAVNIFDNLNEQDVILIKGSRKLGLENVLNKIRGV